MRPFILLVLVLVVLLLLSPRPTLPTARRRGRRCLPLPTATALPPTCRRLGVLLRGGQQRLGGAREAVRARGQEPGGDVQFPKQVKGLLYAVVWWFLGGGGGWLGVELALRASCKVHPPTTWHNIHTYRSGSGAPCSKLSAR